MKLNRTSFSWLALALAPACSSTPDMRAPTPAPAPASAAEPSSASSSSLKVGDNIIEPLHAVNGSTVYFVLTSDVPPAVTIVEQSGSASPDPAPAAGETVADIYRRFAPDRPMPAELAVFADLTIPTKKAAAPPSAELVCADGVGREDCDTPHAKLHSVKGPAIPPRPSNQKADEVCSPLWFQNNLCTWNTIGGNYCKGTAIDWDWQYCGANEGAGAYVYAHNIYADSWLFCNYNSSGAASIVMSDTDNGGHHYTFSFGPQQWLRGSTANSPDIFGFYSNRYSWTWGLNCDWCDVQVAGGTDWR